MAEVTDTTTNKPTSPGSAFGAVCATTGMSILLIRNYPNLRDQVGTMLPECVTIRAKQQPALRKTFGRLREHDGAIVTIRHTRKQSHPATEPGLHTIPLSRLPDTLIGRCVLVTCQS